MLQVTNGTAKADLHQTGESDINDFWLMISAWYFTFRAVVLDSLIHPVDRPSSLGNPGLSGSLVSWVLGSRVNATIPAGPSFSTLYNHKTVFDCLLFLF